MVKFGIGIVLAAVAGAVLLVAAAGARDRGRNTYCRNNLRKLGEMAHDQLRSQDERTAVGRAFWQEVRVEKFTTTRQGKSTWVVRFGGLNPFGCPVRGVQPLDLSELTPEELARIMSDPTTIDYRGPKMPGGSPASKLEVIGGDLEGNHPVGGGHVLFIDSSISQVRDAVEVKPVGEAPGASSNLSE